MIHGFLSYLMKCGVKGERYTIFGYRGKQVRDNIHSFDLVNAFYHFYQKPRRGEVYNIGGGREKKFSMLEAKTKFEKNTGKKMAYTYSPKNRIGDHMWYISSLKKFKFHYPSWIQQFTLQETCAQIF